MRKSKILSFLVSLVLVVTNLMSVSIYAEDTLPDNSPAIEQEEIYEGDVIRLKNITEWMVLRLYDGSNPDDGAENIDIAPRKGEINLANETIAKFYDAGTNMQLVYNNGTVVENSKRTIKAKPEIKAEDYVLAFKNTVLESRPSDQGFVRKGNTLVYFYDVSNTTPINSEELLKLLSATHPNGPTIDGANKQKAEQNLEGFSKTGDDSYLLNGEAINTIDIVYPRIGEFWGGFNKQIAGKDDPEYDALYGDGQGGYSVTHRVGIVDRNWDQIELLPSDIKEKETGKSARYVLPQEKGRNALNSTETDLKVPYTNAQNKSYAMQELFVVISKKSPTTEYASLNASVLRKEAFVYPLYLIPVDNHAPVINDVDTRNNLSIGESETKTLDEAKVLLNSTIDITTISFTDNYSTESNGTDLNKFEWKEATTNQVVTSNDLQKGNTYNLYAIAYDLAGYKAEKLISTLTVKQDLTLKQVKIVTPPTKTEYTVGDTVNLDGMEVELIYTDGTTDTTVGPIKSTDFDSKGITIDLYYDDDTGNIFNKDIAFNKAGTVSLDANFQGKPSVPVRLNIKEADTNPPTIDHKAVYVGYKGDEINYKITATDNVKLKEFYLVKESVNNVAVQFGADNEVFFENSFGTDVDLNVKEKESTLTVKIANTREVKGSWERYLLAKDQSGNKNISDPLGDAGKIKVEIKDQTDKGNPAEIENTVNVLKGTKITKELLADNGIKLGIDDITKSFVYNKDGKPDGVSAEDWATKYDHGAEVGPSKNPIKIASVELDGVADTDTPGETEQNIIVTYSDNSSDIIRIKINVEDTLSATLAEVPYQVEGRKIEQTIKVIEPNKEGTTITSNQVNGLSIDAQGNLVGTPTVTDDQWGDLEEIEITIPVELTYGTEKKDRRCESNNQA